MVKHAPPEQLPDQGYLFRVQDSDGAAANSTEHVFEMLPEGQYPDADSQLEPTSAESVLLEVTAESLKTKHRREGQRGKHSARESGQGSYVAGMQLGKFLPGFGPVKERNWEEAKQHARKLDAAQHAGTTLFQKDVEAVQDVITTLTAAHSAVSSRKELKELTNTGKLELLRDAHGAGFMPTTNREKTDGIALVDYLNTEKHPGGIADRLTEIFYHAQKQAKDKQLTPREGLAMANDAVRSVVHEWGDYHADAARSLEQLRQLDTIVRATMNPNLTLATVLEQHAEAMPDYNVLVRYYDLSQLRDTGVTPDFKPLKTREDRTVQSQHKNKTVHDAYSVTHADTAVQEHANRVVESMTVLQARTLLIPAIADQKARFSFWDTILHSTGSEFQQYADQALHPAV